MKECRTHYVMRMEPLIFACGSYGFMPKVNKPDFAMTWDRVNCRVCKMFQPKEKNKETENAALRYVLRTAPRKLATRL